MDLTRALLAARPGETWTMLGDDLANLEWLSGTTKPTMPELQTAWDALVAKDTKEESDHAAGRGYAKLNALKNMTPAQVQTWVANNVNNLADARDAITTLAIAVGLLARRL
jgi:hypothetical protein